MAHWQKPSSNIEQRRQDWLNSVQQQVATKLESALQPSSNSQSLTASVSSIHELANRNIEMIENNAAEMRRKGQKLPQIACKKGCDICCFIRVKASIPEVLHIADHVRSTFTDAEIENLKAKIDANLAAFEGLTGKDRLNKMVPCPLLEDHSCSVHSVRPVPCRMHHSTDLEVCKQAFDQPDKVQIPHFLDVDTVVHPIIHGIRTAVRSANLKDPGLVLARALKIAMEDPQAREKWLNGEDLFAPAVDKELQQLEEFEMRRRMIQLKR